MMKNIDKDTVNFKVCRAVRRESLSNKSPLSYDSILHGLVSLKLTVNQRIWTVLTTEYFRDQWMIALKLEQMELTGLFPEKNKRNVT